MHQNYKNITPKQLPKVSKIVLRFCAIANSQGLLQAETELRLKKNTEGYRGYKNPLYSL